MPEQSKVVECMLLKQFDLKLLLPRASLVDVLDAEHMNIVVDLQGGIIGKIQWHGWTVPFLSFEAVSSGAIPKFNSQSKAAVLFAMTDEQVRPYIALTVQDDPEPVSLKDDDLELLDTLEDNEFIKSKVKLPDGSEAYIPDLTLLVSYTSQYF